MVRNLLIARALLVLVAIGPGWTAAQAHSAPDVAATTQRIDELFSFLDRPDGFAASVGIFRDGQPLYRRDFGLANREHHILAGPKSVYSLASMSKQFTAFAVLLLAREGRLSLEDDVRRYLPELPSYDEEHPITIDHLMHHTSGLRDHLTLVELTGARMNEDYVGIEEQYRLVIRQRALCFATGERFMYTNTGYLLLALVVERVTGGPFAEFVAERIFRPLGMDRTRVMDDPHDPVPGRVQGCALSEDGSYRVLENTFPNYGYAGVLSTVEDLARWDRNFYEPVIGDAWVIELMTRPGATGDGEEVAYGGGLNLHEHQGHRLHEHGGGEEGFRTQFWRFPDDRLTIIVLVSGGRDMARQVDPVLPRVADLLLGVQEEPADSREEEAAAAGDAEDDTSDSAEFEPAAGRPELPALLAGLYSRPIPGDVLEFRVVDGVLECSYYGPGETEARTTVLLSAMDGQRFTRDGGSERFLFGPSPDAPPGFVEIELPGSDGALRFGRLPSPPDPEQFAGRYYSPDLDVEWELSLDGDLLHVRLPRRAGRELFDAPHRYVGDDTFVAPIQHSPRLRLRRDAGGEVSGFTWHGYNRITLELERSGATPPWSGS